MIRHQQQFSSLLQGAVLKPAFIYGSRDVKLTGPNGKERKVNLPLQRVGGPLSKLTSTSIGKKIAGAKDICPSPRGLVVGLVHDSDRSYLTTSEEGSDLSSVKVGTTAEQPEPMDAVGMLLEISCTRLVVVSVVTQTVFLARITFLSPAALIAVQLTFAER